MAYLLAYFFFPMSINDVENISMLLKKLPIFFKLSV